MAEEKSQKMSCTDLTDLESGGSFSFSCSDSDVNLSSALNHFTDLDDQEDDSDESYIEIALDQGDHRLKNGHDDDDGEDEGGRLGHVDNLRISFSSSFPFPAYSNLNYNQDDKHVVSETASDPGAVEQSTTSGESDTDVRGKRSKLPAVNRLVNTLFFSLWSSSDTSAKKIDGAAEDHYNISHPQLLVHVNNDDFVQSRKSSNIRSTINGGIMKLFFKFRAMNLGTLVASLGNKPRRVVCPPDKEHNGHGNFTNGLRKNRKSKAASPVNKFFVQKKQGKRGDKMETTPEIGAEKSSMLEINLNAVRGVLEAIGSSMGTGVNRKERRTRSCPSSIKNSPIHQGFASDQNKLYARETSIQAAIAHCKI